MVKKLLKKNKDYYLCEECNFAYDNRKTALKCQNWCKKYHSCNVEITKDAVPV